MAEIQIDYYHTVCAFGVYLAWYRRSVSAWLTLRANTALELYQVVVEADETDNKMILT